MNETYYYGQGKVYLARRGDDGCPGAWRWVGDVSAFNINIAVEQHVTKISRGGRLLQSRRVITSSSASVTSTWHDFSVENVSALLLSTPVVEPFAIRESVDLPKKVQKGEMYTLPHTRVFNVTIAELTPTIDYEVEPLWGGITFLTTPIKQPVTVSYEHLQNVSIPLSGFDDVEYALRYQGVNLAEEQSHVLIELYRLNFDPLSVINIISSGNNLAGMESVSQLFADMSNQRSSLFGYFGRIQFVNPLPELTYNGQAQFDGKHKYRGY